MKHQTTIDANTLNKNFYNELLYILGLEEKKEDGKPIIVHNGVKNTLFDAISQNLNLDKQRDFEAIFRLLTTWNNRVLFLRLLESMLLSFEHFEKPFLELRDFKDLHTLFFEVLAKKEDERDEDLKRS